jgi:L-fuconolactonase
VVEHFGFDRLVFGSDWPVSKLTHRYPEWIEIVAWALADCSADERRKLFRDNAMAFYRLDPAAGR